MLENVKRAAYPYAALLKNIEERERIQRSLQDKNIPSVVYYLKAMRLQQAFEEKRDMFHEP